MQLTPEQQAIIDKTRAAGENRAILTFTPGQKAEWREAVRRELDGRNQTSVHIQKIKAAAEQSGFFGDVRRAIAVSGRPVDELARDCGIDASVLSDFRAGEADLPSAALDQLIATLGLRLMWEIPR